MTNEKHTHRPHRPAPPPRGAHAPPFLSNFNNLILRVCARALRLRRITTAPPRGAGALGAPLATRGRVLNWRRIAALAGLVAFWGAAALSARSNSLASFSDPPKRYQCQAQGVRLLIADNPAQLCQQWREGYAGSACCYVESLNAVIIPSPWSVPRDTLAQCIRHEIGHACGWPGDHPR